MNLEIQVEIKYMKNDKCVGNHLAKLFSHLIFLNHFSSVAQSCPTLCDHMTQHARPPCPSPTPRVYSNSCPLSQWCQPAISSSVVPFSSSPQSFSASGSFPMSQLFASGGQELEFQLQHQSFQWTPGLIYFRMDWLDLLAVQGTLKSLLQNHSSKGSILWLSAFFTVQLSHPLSQWCHSAISSSVVPFSSCPQSLPASKSFPMSQLFAWGGQSYGVSASASVLAVFQHSGLIYFRMDWLDLLAVQGTLKTLLWLHSSKASILWLSL